MSGDRENLAREMSDAYRAEKLHHGIGYDAWLASADIAIASADRRVAEWMGNRSYATGHGDTVEDMLAELEAQAGDLRVAEAYEAAAVVAEDIQPGENKETVMQIAMCIRALSPAREGGRDDE